MDLSLRGWLQIEGADGEAGGWGRPPRPLDAFALAAEAPSRVLPVSRRLAAADQDREGRAHGQHYASQRAAAEWLGRIEQAPLNHHAAAIVEAPRASPPKR